MYRRNRAGRLDAGGTRHQLEQLEESECEVSPGAARRHLSTIKDQAAHLAYVPGPAWLAHRPAALFDCPRMSGQRLGPVLGPGTSGGCVVAVYAL